MITLKIETELSSLLNNLNKFEDVLKNKVVRSGLVASSKPIKKSMQSNAPKNRGDLAKSINHKSLNKRQKARLSISHYETAIVIGPNKKINGTSVAWRANFIENGVKAHSIKSKINKKLGRKLKLKVGNRVIEGDIKHPGIKSNPFMEKSINQNESNMPNLFYKGMARSLGRIRKQ